MLILASSSPNRKKLLAKLKLDFAVISPDIDESQKPNEDPQEMVKRLSREKAEEVKKIKPNDVIIASDQIGLVEGEILTKPKTAENAIKQLKNMSGKTIDFYTGICVYGENIQVDIATFRVVMRNLSQSEIINYIKLDNPLNCAGSFKSEGLGIALFASMFGEDYNSLIGLPLIKLINMLKNENIKVI